MIDLDLIPRSSFEASFATADAKARWIDWLDQAFSAG